MVLKFGEYRRSAMQDISDRLALDQYQALLRFRVVTNLSDADSHEYISDFSKKTGFTFNQSAEVLIERVCTYWNGSQKHLEIILSR